MNNNVDFRQNRTMNTDFGPSPDLWADCPVSEFTENPSKGFERYDDFQFAPVLVTPTITTQALYGGGYKAFGSASGTLLGKQAEGGGGLEFITGGSDNDGINIQLIQTPLKMALGKGDLWFEGRASFASIADTVGGWFFGLAETMTLTAIVPITAAGAIADKNLVGFHRDEADGDNLDVIYKADGVTKVTVKADAVSTTANTHTVAGSLAAATFIKLGMRLRASTGVLTFFLNGVALPDTKTLPSAAGTDFPNDVLLAPIFAGVAATGAAQTANLSWWRWAQRLVG